MTRAEQTSAAAVAAATATPLSTTTCSHCQLQLVFSSWDTKTSNIFNIVKHQICLTVIV